MTDIFAGAGGSSSGAVQVPGVHVALAANHWQLAVDVHNSNHPTTEHACVDLHMEDPRNFPKTDILWASPECTKWSIANSKATALSVEMGGDPSLFDDVPDELISTDEDEISRSRLLMFDVLRFIEYHRYRAVVVENVVDIATQPKYGTAWESWKRGLHNLGYQFRIVSLNSMHAGAMGRPAPQSRDRLYIIAVPVGEKFPDVDSILRPRAYCGRCDKIVETSQSWKNGKTVGRYRAQYVYVCTGCWKAVEPAWLPASTAIDWSIQGQRIGDRTKPLSPKTMARIREGLRRYGHEFLTIHRGDRTPGVADNRVMATTDALPALTASGNFLGLAVPVEGRDGKEARPINKPLRTMTTRNETGILTMLRGTNSPKLTNEPLDTMAASGNHHGLLVPYYSSSDTGRPTSDPIGTLTTRDRYALLMRNNSSKGDGAEMVTPSHEPMRTLTTHGHQSVLEPATIDPEDCSFRMLEPHEIAAGMSFPADYRWVGSKRDRVRMAGNAVTPPAARDLVAVVAESLGGAA
ncbi:DNA cytosine methyltransferase [Nakamurella lactea]|uniref:DNA cytosine methyltransferase n=1 Tax=Nakamurella lactea TaxID=459515 RepID=UPI001B7FD88C|nr:DNA cytosine methyltransferase [Nakamurella lactea]